MTHNDGVILTRSAANTNDLPLTALEGGNRVAAKESPQNEFHVGESSRQGGYMAMLMADESDGESPLSQSIEMPVVPNINLGLPIVGVAEVAGRQRAMEDALSVHPNLCMPLINGGLPVHFFGVFDGHGGSHISMMCKHNMHSILEEELMRYQYPFTLRLPDPLMEVISIQEKWTTILNRCFARTEMKALSTCLYGSIGFRCTCVRECVLSKAGSTAVVVVLTQEHIVAANCGNSRALLCRGGRIVRLTFDHKPDRVDERKRIESCGGSIFLLDAPLVQGVLTMSRAIGDEYLKPAVTSEPEVIFTRKAGDDEFLILASDGLWDVVSNEMACSVVCEYLRETPRTIGPCISHNIPINSGNGEPHDSASAAAFLAHLALARGSRDDISVIVVDLKRAGIGVS